MSQLSVSAPVQSAELRAVVVRCGCGAPQSHASQVCPRPLQTEDLGTIAYYHRSPWKRLLWRMRRLLPTRG